MDGAASNPVRTWPPDQDRAGPSGAPPDRAGVATVIVGAGLVLLGPDGAVAAALVALTTGERLSMPATTTQLADLSPLWTSSLPS